jgi:hypothetical protein
MRCPCDPGREGRGTPAAHLNPGGRALEQRLTYADLKASARNGLTYSFLKGGEKAALRARLEEAFSVFEAKAAGGAFPP